MAVGNAITADPTPLITTLGKVIPQLADPIVVIKNLTNKILSLTDVTANPKVVNQSVNDIYNQVGQLVESLWDLVCVAKAKGILSAPNGSLDSLAADLKSAFLPTNDPYTCLRVLMQTLTKIVSLPRDRKSVV